MKQWRIVFSSFDQRGTLFIDAADEAGARAFFAQAFPRSTVVSITLQPVDPCAQYERREEPKDGAA